MQENANYGAESRRRSDISYIYERKNGFTITNMLSYINKGISELYGSMVSISRTLLIQQFLPSNSRKNTNVRYS